MENVTQNSANQKRGQFYFSVRGGIPTHVKWLSKKEFNQFD